MSRFDFHNHTEFSNLRLADSTNTVRSLAERASELGLAGIAITDHESLSAHVQVEKVQEDFPHLKIVRGNEIYLTKTRDSGQYYNHFLLLALDAVGHKMLRELSSYSWSQSYYDRGMERVPTLYSEIEEVVKKYGQGHIHASTACLAGPMSRLILELDQAEKMRDKKSQKEAHDNIVKFIHWAQETFGKEYFTLEVAPSQSEEQIIVNKRMKSISNAFHIDLCAACDAHYLSPKEREIHKALLNSKDGEREVDSFYKYAYLQTDDEMRENLATSDIDADECFANSLKILAKVKDYTLAANQRIPQVEVKDYPKKKVNDTKHPILTQLFASDNVQERYWVNKCVEELNNRNLTSETYMDRLEEEADIMDTIGKKLNTCIFSYPVFLKHYLDTVWEVGSPVGVARGSAGAGLNHYLLGISQLNPITHNLPYFRFLNKERIELPDIDFDIAPTKRPAFFEKIRQERGENGLAQVCTFSTISSKAAIKIAAKGYRSMEYPEGIPLEEAEYMSTLVPIERGFVYSISDMLYGNQEKDRKPVKDFIKAVNKYHGFKDILLGIEGLVIARSVHASGIIFFGEDPYERSCFMKAKDGSLITQWSLHDQEYCGETKYDCLVVEELDIFAQCISILQEHGKIDSNLTLREAYDEYIHPDVLPLDDNLLWDEIDKADILNLFQFNTQVGSQVVKLLKPRNVQQLTACNALMRLMPEKGQETPYDRYYRMKQDISLWYEEMDRYGLTKEEQAVLEPYCLKEYGTPSSQEAMMLMALDKNIANYTLGESNALRKTTAKKIMDEIPAAREKFINSCKSKPLGKYVWDKLIHMQLGYSFN